ncbi:MAG: ankyrin repeat domain-containing protein [Nitrosopumilus sp.]
MRAKFINEDIKDFFKPKSEEEIKSSMGNLDPKDLLYKSIYNNFLPGVKKALEDGADVHADIDYALRLASEKGYYDIVKLLLDNGADVHAQDDWALQWASEYDHYNVVKLLIDNGADVHARDDRALQWASENGHDDVVELLKRYM